MDAITEIIAARYFYRAVKTPQPIDIQAAFKQLDACAAEARQPSLKAPVPDPLTPVFHQLKMMANEMKSIIE